MDRLFDLGVIFEVDGGCDNGVVSFLFSLVFIRDLLKIDWLKLLLGDIIVFKVVGRGCISLL